MGWTNVSRAQLQTHYPQTEDLAHATGCTAATTKKCRLCGANTAKIRRTLAKCPVHDERDRAHRRIQLSERKYPGRLHQTIGDHTYTDR
eukprot:scaffold29529_cov39-Tisochrysis_lutea.AAC.3